MFTGSSPYSADLQNAITRAVAIASMPITQLNNDLSSFNSQSTALSGIDSKFVMLQNAVRAVSNATGSSSLSASSSASTVATASVGAGAVQGQYTIEVQNAVNRINRKDCPPFRFHILKTRIPQAPWREVRSL